VRIVIGEESGELCRRVGSLIQAALLAHREPRRLLGPTADVSRSVRADLHSAARSSHADTHPTQPYRATADKERCSQRKPSPMDRIRISQELIIIKQGIPAIRRRKSVDLTTQRASNV
jgi:hypothetical protein